MSAMPETTLRRPNFPACKVIYCIVPDDGTDKRVLVEIRDKYGIVRAGSRVCRGIGVLAEAKTKRGTLPEPSLVKQMYVICEDDQAKEIFDFIFWSAHVDKPHGGLIWQQAVTGGTPFELPADIPDEKTGA